MRTVRPRGVDGPEARRGGARARARSYLRGSGWRRWRMPRAGPDCRPLKEAAERLELRRCRDELGRELLDLRRTAAEEDGRCPVGSCPTGMRTSSCTRGPAPARGHRGQAPDRDRPVGTVLARRARRLALRDGRTCSRRRARAAAPEEARTGGRRASRLTGEPLHVRALLRPEPGRRAAAAFSARRSGRRVAGIPDRREGPTAPTSAAPAPTRSSSRSGASSSADGALVRSELAERLHHDNASPARPRAGAAAAARALPRIEQHLQRLEATGSDRRSSSSRPTSRNG